MKRSTTIMGIQDSKRFCRCIQIQEGERRCRPISVQNEQMKYGDVNSFCFSSLKAASEQMLKHFHSNNKRAGGLQIATGKDVRIYVRYVLNVWSC